MSKQTIEIFVCPKGTVKAEAHGYVGKTCADAMKFIKAAFGKQSESTKKREYHQTAGLAAKAK